MFMFIEKQAEDSSLSREGMNAVSSSVKQKTIYHIMA